MNINNIKYFFALVITLTVIATLETMSLNESQMQSVFGQSNNTSSMEHNNILMDNTNEMEENENEIIGVVKNGTFIVADLKEPRKLTGTHVVEAITPEAKQIDITEYEGKAILVSYEQIDDEWIWAAAITDIADPILTKVIKKVFEIK